MGFIDGELRNVSRMKPIFLVCFLFLIILPISAATIQWSDTSTVSGKISTFQKGFQYTSSLSDSGEGGINAAETPTSEPTTEPTSEPTTEPTSEPTTEPTSEPGLYWTFLVGWQDQTWHGVTGAIVGINGGGNDKQCTTVSGSCDIDGLTPGSYTYTVSCPGYAPDSGPITLPDHHLYFGLLITPI